MYNQIVREATVFFPLLIIYMISDQKKNLIQDLQE